MAKPIINLKFTMKKVRLFPAIALIFLTLLGACDTEPIDSGLLNTDTNNNPGDDDDDDDTDDPGVFKVDIDGTNWVAATTSVVYNDDYLAISAIKPDGTFFQITVPNPHVGTFEFSETEPDPSSMDGLLAMAYMAPGETSAYIAASDNWGEFSTFSEYVDTAIVTITEIDTENETVTGTFEFTGAHFIIDSENPDPEFQEIVTKSFTNGIFTNLSYGAVPVTPTDNVVTVKLDGETFTPTSVSAISLMGNISISAMRGSVETIALNFPQTITQGTYSLGMFTYIGQYNLDQTPQGIFSASGGTLTITGHDTVNHHITGTFNFTAESFTSDDTHEITDGTFDVEY